MRMSRTEWMKYGAVFSFARIMEKKFCSAAIPIFVRTFTLAS